MVDISRRTLLLGAGAASLVGGFQASAPHAEGGAQPSLPIPPELRANADGVITLDARPGSMRFLADRVTATYGVNGPYLGPAIRVRRGERVTMHVTNSLPEATTMHWHGLIIPGSADGGPIRSLRRECHGGPNCRSINRPRRFGSTPTTTRGRLSR
jgi:blue copper oxidase